MPSRLLPAIPTLEDLLASEPLQAVATRFQPQAMIAGVRSFLGLLDREVRDAAADLRIPDPAALARQIADWLLAGKLPVLRPMINATGVLFHPEAGQIPLAEEAVHALRIVAGGATGYFQDAGSERRVPAEAALETVLGRVTGAEAAWAAGSLNLAMHAVFSGLAAGKEIVVARGEVVDDGDGTDLAALVVGSGARLREVGATNRAAIRDYEQALTPETGLILRFQARVAPEPAGVTQSAPREELVTLARARGVSLVEVLSGGGLIDLPEILPPGTNSLRTALQAGVDLVLLRGEDLLGGPVSGLVAGRRALVEAARSQPLARLSPISPLAEAALLATLALYAEPEKVRYRVPTIELLATSADNLKNRAERMAPQIAACPWFRDAHAVELRGHLRLQMPSPCSLPSWGVSIRPDNLSALQLQTQLLEGSSKILSAVSGERLLLNLRAVSARMDRELIGSFEAIAPG